MINHRVNLLRHHRIRKGCHGRVRIVGRERRRLRQPLGEGVGDFLAMSWCPNAGGIDTRSTTVGCDRRLDQVQVLLPIVSGVVAEDDLAETRAMQLDAGIVLIGLGGRFTAKEHGSIHGTQQLARAGMIGGIEPESLAGHAGCTESFDHAVRGPRFFAPRLEHDRRFQHDRRNP